MTDTNQERKKAVREAWKNERSLVREGMGTRDWSQSEQREISAKGRANGYEGHHMKSVKEYPRHAGDPQNIQFLNRSEHVNGAHKGNTQNATNGYYDPKTGVTRGFDNRSPHAPQSQPLSAPLPQRQQDIASKREQARQQAAQKAKTETKQPTAKTQPAASSNTAQPAANKGIEAARQKASANQSGVKTSQPANQGIKSYQSKVSGQSAGASKSSANTGQTSSNSQGQGR